MHKYGYTELEVKEMLRSRGLKWSRFIKWMAGQTVARVDGQTIFYKTDVERWIGAQTTGKQPEWD